MRIVVDTNILISANLWDGASDLLIKKAELGFVELFLSEEILEEYEMVLDYKEIQDKIRNKNLFLKRSINTLRNISTIVEPKFKLDVVKEDPDDNIIVECAIEGDVDYIVSQDKHLLNIKEYHGIKIVRPDKFLAILGI